MKPFAFLLFVVLVIPSAILASEDWGETGHRATGEIAQKHLNRKARKAINDMLNGQSLAFVSTYADEIRSDDRYRSYGPWHYVNFPFDSNFKEHPRSERGDIVLGIETAIKVLKDDTASKEDKAFYLKLLVHFIGDLHQPLHVGIADDKGGNDFQVRWFDDGTNLHRVWDTKMIESYNMSYSELAANTDKLSKAQLQQIRQGGVEDWVEESRALCLDIYENTKVGEKLSFKYRYRYIHVVRKQLQKGGVRLASILNDIFS